MASKDIKDRLVDALAVVGFRANSKL